MNGHYSPHAKALVLRYKDSLRTAASVTSSQYTTDNEASSQMSLEPVAGPFRIKGGSTANATASHHTSHDQSAVVPMPEAPMPLVQVEGGPSSMQILCDAALAVQESDSHEGQDDDREDEYMQGCFRRKEKRPASVVPEDADDAAEASAQAGLGSKPPARRNIQKAQRDQRRTRKATLRHAQISGASTSSAAKGLDSPRSGGTPNVQTGYYRRPMMYPYNPAYFDYHHRMQNGGPPVQNANAFQSCHFLRTKGFRPYGDPTQPDGMARFNNAPAFGFRGPLYQHAFPYMGVYYPYGYIPHNGQGFRNDPAYPDVGSDGLGGMNGNDHRTNPLSKGPVEKVSHSTDNE